MTPLSTSFQMTDAVMTRAVQEEVIAFARKHWKPRDLLVIAASAAVFVAAVRTGSHWLWWLAGLPMALFVPLWLIWLGAYLLWPGFMRSRLQHLPHRTVILELSAEHISIESATEKLQVRWSELKVIKELPTFWILCFRAGTRVPIPIEAISEPIAARLRQAQVQVHGSVPT